MATLGKCSIIPKKHTPYRIYLSQCGHNITPTHTCFQCVFSISSFLVARVLNFLSFNNKEYLSDSIVELFQIYLRYSIWICARHEQIHTNPVKVILIRFDHLNFKYLFVLKYIIVIQNS